MLFISLSLVLKVFGNFEMTLSVALPFWGLFSAFLAFSLPLKWHLRYRDHLQDTLGSLITFFVSRLPRAGVKPKLPV